MLIFANNAETTTLGALTALAMNETREDTVEVDFAARLLFHDPYLYGAEMHVTLHDPTGASAVVEIAKLKRVVTAGSSVTFTLERVRDDHNNSDGPSWAAGAGVSARVTAGMLGSFVQAPAADSQVCALEVGSDSGQRKNIAFSSLPVVSLATRHSDGHQDAKEYPAGAELVFRTRNIDVGPPDAHDSGASYYGGEIVVPSPADGYQYQFLPSPDAVTSGAVSFPGDGNAVEAFSVYDPLDHAGWWAATEVPIVLQESMPGGKFVLTEVGFMRKIGSGSPATPAVVSIGTMANSTLFLDHANLAGAKRVSIPDEGSFGVNDIVFTVHSQSDVSLIGSFYFKGFVIHTGA